MLALNKYLVNSGRNLIQNKLLSFPATDSLGFPAIDSLSFPATSSLALPATTSSLG
jgi:hypothetical protein